MELEADDYTVGWICALPIEKAAAIAILDEEHAGLTLSSNKEDINSYTLGRVGQHNVVIVCLPAGVYGANSAATVATNLSRSFPSLRFGLMVGIGGGAPNEENDVRLGDIVVSQPSHGTSGVIQYDFGKRVGENTLHRTGYLNGPPTILLNASASLQASKSPLDLGNRITAVAMRAEEKDERFTYPNSEDHLFRPDYAHVSGTGRQRNTCARCDPSQQVPRQAREHDNPIAHYGIIASGNQVIKDATVRDKICKDTNAICFEMEAAGLMNYLPCMVIRGVCDYSDSHKNKSWQAYAAITAAAYAKELLNHVPVLSSSASNASEGVRTDVLKSLQAFSSVSRDPETEKIGVERRKDRLIDGSYEWVKEDEVFKNWLTAGPQILRLIGGPGKGKTMIMIGITNEFELGAKSSREEDNGRRSILRLPPSTYLSYFLCQGANEHLNSATSVLKGILLYLLRKNYKLATHLQKQYDLIGPAEFSTRVDLNFLQLLLFSILDDPSSPVLLFVVDALDECLVGRSDLMALIRRSTERSPRIRWLISSRPHEDIRSSFAPSSLCTEIILEENQRFIDTAIGTYIDLKVSELHAQKNYRPQDKQDVERILKDKCGGTFLWVHLACRELESSEALSYETASILDRLPLELASVYARMLEQINNLKDTKASSRCLDILATAAVVYRPLHLGEIGLMALNADHLPDVERLVKLCGSFLTVANESVYFIHQSAKDYLTSESLNIGIFGSGGKESRHRSVFRACVRTLSDPHRLKKDIAGLEWPGTSYTEITDAQRACVRDITYACCYWARHLEPLALTSVETTMLVDFFQSCLLHWLEALCLVGKLADGLIQIELLEGMKISQNGHLQAIVEDAGNFLRHSYSTIEALPLQIYSSALIFSPEQSLTRVAHLPELSKWLSPRTRSSIDETWDPRQNRVLQGAPTDVTAIAYSTSGILIASICSFDSSIRVWNALTGLRLHTFSVPHISFHSSLYFSPDDRFVAAFLRSGVIQACDTTTGNCSTLLETGLSDIQEVVFSADWKLLGLKHALLPDIDMHRGVGAPSSRSSQLWDIAAKKCLDEFVSEYPIISLMITPHGKLIAVYIDERDEMRLWDLRARKELSRDFGIPIGFLRGNVNTSSSICAAVSPNGSFIAFSGNLGVDVWDVSTYRPHKVVESHSSMAGFDGYGLSFSGDSKLLLVVSSSGSVRIRDTATWECVYVLEHRTASKFLAAAFCPADRTLIAAASSDMTVRTWSVIPKQSFRADRFKDSRYPIRSIITSPDSYKAVSVAVVERPAGASGSLNWVSQAEHRALVWNTFTDGCLHSLELPFGGVRFLDMMFSPDGRVLVSACSDDKIYLWDPETGRCLSSFGLSDHLREGSDYVVISSDCSMFAVSRGSGEIADSRAAVRVWKVATGECLHMFHMGTFPGQEWRWVGSATPIVEFSPDGGHIAISRWDEDPFGYHGVGTLEIRDATTGKCVGTFGRHLKEVTSIAFSPRGNLIASALEDGDIQLFGLSGTPGGHWQESGDEAGVHHHESIQHFVGHSDNAFESKYTKIAFSPNGKVLVFIGWDRTVKLWDIASGKCFRQQIFRHQAPKVRRWGLFRPRIRKFEFSDDSDFFVWGYNGPNITIPTSYTWPDRAEDVGETEPIIENSMFLGGDGLYLNGRMLLAIPPAFSPTTFDYKNGVFSIGSFGQVYFIKLELDRLREPTA
ncbi:hypothetical protein TWF281_004265 [Arthrobotrys megalospora]